MRLSFTFMANFRQRMGREEYWACPSTLCRASSSQSGVQVSSRRSAAPQRYVLLLQCLRLSLSFPPLWLHGRSSSTQGDSHCSCVVMLPLHQHWAYPEQCLWCQMNYLFNLIKKAQEPPGNCWGEKSHMAVAAIPLWRFFWAIEAPTGTPKTSCPCARCCSDIHWVVAQLKDS